MSSTVAMVSAVRNDCGRLLPAMRWIELTFNLYLKYRVTTLRALQNSPTFP